MNTYREIFAVGEFRTLFAAQAVTVVGKTMESLALSTLVYAHTGSPFLAALAYLAGFLPQAVGALALGGLADRLPPRALLVSWALARAVAVAVLALGVLPVWGMFALVMTCGLFDAVAGGARQALLADLLPGNGYVLGRSALNIAVGATQIAGFALGGTLLAWAGPHAALWSGAALGALVALMQRLGLRARPPRVSGRPTWRQIRAVNGELLGDRRIRGLLLVQWVPNGLVVGAEALYVPYAGGSAAGALFIAAAGGMLAGDLVVGRWTTPERRVRLAVPLFTLMAVPYLFFALSPGTWVATALVAVASFGFAGHLGTQERYVAAVPERVRGQALGLAGSGTMAGQALAASGTGTLAEFVPVSAAMALAGVASLVATACLCPALTRPVRAREASRPGGGS
ncbi:MFS transporter [Streptosporangium sp. NPDC002524]|uniref:MFS transporter n=1 Tax=Streptosporangium sp. NPDC002524 TaxID=3154537 RepID=UPI0033177E4A